MNNSNITFEIDRHLSARNTAITYIESRGGIIVGFFDVPCQPHRQKVVVAAQPHPCYPDADLQAICDAAQKRVDDTMKDMPHERRVHPALQ